MSVMTKQVRTVVSKSSVLGTSIVALALASGWGNRVSAQERIIPPQMQGTYDNFHYAPAVRVGNTVYASGVVSANPDPTEQFREIFQRLTIVLEAAGASLGDIVEMTTFHVDMDAHVAAFQAVRDEFFTENYPAWTAIGVEQLFSPPFLVEVKVVAVVPDGS